MPGEKNQFWDQCTCGHLRDEHKRFGGECQDDDCKCICFDWDPDASDIHDIAREENGAG
jgi:hypothetical protein